MEKGGEGGAEASTYNRRSMMPPAASGTAGMS